MTSNTRTAWKHRCVREGAKQLVIGSKRPFEACGFLWGQLKLTFEAV